MRSTRRIMLAVVAVALALSAFTAVAIAVTKHKATRTKPVVLGPGQTIKVNVRYPHALRYANAKYSCTVRKRALLQGVKPAPKLKLVKILFRGSVKGGSVCQVKAVNNNAIGTAPVQLRVKAQTRWTT